MTNGQPSLAAISIGNSRTHVGRFESGQLANSARLDNANLAAIVERVLAEWATIAREPRAAVVLASVGDDVADRLVPALEDQLSVDVYVVGTDVPVPIGRQLAPETITGVDRLLNAAAAYDTLQQACVVVDAGTAVTVDFVDGEGTFHGGAIAPGATMQLRALHEHTSALPDLAFSVPDEGAFGRSTAQAMLRGVYHGIRGLVARLVEEYATEYGAFPTVVATGGDAQMLFHNDELIDRIVPDLTLMGIATAARHALAGDEDADLRA